MLFVHYTRCCCSRIHDSIVVVVDVLLEACHVLLHSIVLSSPRLLFNENNTRTWYNGDDDVSPLNDDLIFTLPLDSPTACQLLLNCFPTVSVMETTRSSSSFSLESLIPVCFNGSSQSFVSILRTLSFFNWLAQQQVIKQLLRVLRHIYKHDHRNCFTCCL